MSDQQDNEMTPADDAANEPVTPGEPAGDTPSDTDASGAEPQTAAAADGETPAAGEGDEIPDAVKAMPDGVVPDGDAAPDASASADAEAMTINEPSMDIPEMGVPVTPALQAHPAEFPTLGAGVAKQTPANIDLLMDVKLPVSIELGRTTLSISEILEWGQGSIVELDTLAGEPVNLMVNNKMVAMGEVVVVDEKFGLRITSLVTPKERLESL